MMKVYLSDYDHDIFVSYGHEDELGRWTERLREELGKALNVILFLKSPGELVDVWIDARLQKNKPLPDELQRHIERSALLIIVMSPFYMRSEWCGKEAEWFAAAACAGGAPDGRVFVVQAFPTERDKWPETIAHLPGYCFFARHPVVRQELPLGWIGDMDDKVAFKQALYILAGDIRLQLDDMKRRKASGQRRNSAPSQSPLHATGAGPGAPLRIVCLETLGAATSARAGAVEQDLRRALGNHNVQIFTPSSLGDVPRDPVGAERYLQRLTRAKADCDGSSSCASIRHFR
jgi:hypothetical protein